MIQKSYIPLKLIIFLLMFNYFITPSLFAQNKTEILLTIDSVSVTEVSAQFNYAENLRKELKFKEAIDEYKKVINAKEDSQFKAEATYDIGLCYCWLNDVENARMFFTTVINEYKTDPLVISFSQYGLSWLKVKEGKFYEAIEILEKELNSGNCNDYEHNAIMLFKIGKIYQKHPRDKEKANNIYRQLIAKYPEAKIVEHPFLNKLKNN